jgi:glutathione S-transferase
MLKDNHPLKKYIEQLMERPAFMRADENFYAKITP